MQDTLTETAKTGLSKQKFIAAVNNLIDDYSYKPNPEDPAPEPPWPWKHAVNKAFDKVFISSQHLSWSTLNPQPLPPKIIFAMALAQEVIDRVFLMQEIAAGLDNNGEERSIIIVSGHLSKFLDDICPTPPRIKFPKKRWPFPWPPQPGPDWTGLELAVIGSNFKKEALLITHDGMQRALNQAGEKLMDVAISRMQ